LTQIKTTYVVEGRAYNEYLGCTIVITRIISFELEQSRSLLYCLTILEREVTSLLKTLQ